MKMLKITLALTVLVSATTFTSCNKYEDGPAISLRSAESRIDNTWEVDKYIDSDGTETAGDSNDPVYTMTKDGELSVVIGSQNASGNWTLNSDETTLRLEYSYSFINFDITYTILRLTSDELWLEDEDGDKTYLKEK